MLIIKVENGNIEKALKQYKSKVIKTKQMKELRDRQEFEKTSVKNRQEKTLAKYVQKKKDQANKD
jgi:small subunit ribosomal protein S21